MKLRVNGEIRTVDVPDDMPLLWVLRDELRLTGTKYGCGIAQCGACTVHVDGQARRSCVTPVSSLEGGARVMGTLFPSLYFQKISAGVVNKGLGMGDLWVNYGALVLFCLAFWALSLALLKGQEA